MTDPPDLAAWLLEQIAKDERDADDYHERGCGYGNGQAHYYACDCGHPVHIKAQCEAERRIIARYQKNALWPHEGTEIEQAIDAGRHKAWRVALCELATVYADRPGFHEGWRA